MHLKIKLNREVNHVEQISQQFTGESIDKTLFRIPSEYGEGFVRCISLPQSIRFYMYCFKLNQRLDLSSTNPEDSDIYVMNFNMSDRSYSKHINNQEVTIGKDLPGGIFFYSPGNDSYGYCNPHISYIFIFITFCGNDLLRNTGDKYQTFLKHTHKNFLYYDELDSITELILRDLIQNESNAENSNLWIQAKVLEITDRVLSRFVSRKNSKHSLNPQDVAQLFKTREILKTGVYQPATSIEDLAKIASMSPTKFKNTFKQVFGQTPYQYYLKVKMQEAKRLLDSRKYTVSEIGYRLGYSNISHFIQAFQKQMQITPGEYLSSQK